MTARSRSTDWPSRRRISSSAVRIGAILLLVTGMFGALAALGDTLFPGTRGIVTEGHTYLKLRNIHPFIAVLTAGHILAVATRQRDNYTDKLFGRYNICDVVAALTGLQAIIGVANIALSAPPSARRGKVRMPPKSWGALETTPSGATSLRACASGAHPRAQSASPSCPATNYAGTSGA